MQRIPNNAENGHFSKVTYAAGGFTETNKYKVYSTYVHTFIYMYTCILNYICKYIYANMFELLYKVYIVFMNTYLYTYM
jgi:hypothetical protein